MMRNTDDSRVDPAATADVRRCGCAGKTPLARVVLPARDRVRTRLRDTSVTLGPDADAALLPRATEYASCVDVVRFDADGEMHTAMAEPPFPKSPDDTETASVAVACALLGDGYADAERLGQELSRVYASFDGRPLRIGKGHAIQLPSATGGVVVVERLTPLSGDESADGDPNAANHAANVDAVHAFPGLDPAEQARVAALNALNDVYTHGATSARAVRPLVAAPRSAAPTPGRVREWFAAGLPDDVSIRSPSVVDHDGTGMVLGASVTAAGASTSTKSPLPDGCAVLVTRPFGGLASYAVGVQNDDDRLREQGRQRLLSDARPVVDVLASALPGDGEAFDPANHVAHVTDVSGEGIAGLGRIAADSDRRLVVDSVPVLDGLAETADASRIPLPDATVETNGPLAVFATPAVVSTVAERLRSVDGCDPRQIGTLRDGGGGPVDATGGRATRFVEGAARWPTASVERDER